MSFPSITNNTLRSLRSDEEIRLFKINSIIQSIYPHVIRTAKDTSDKAYYHEIQFANRVFYKTNMIAILAGLKEFFPEAYIAHTLLSLGTDGQLYDVARLDSTMLHRVSKATENSYIVIDWS